MALDLLLWVSLGINAVTLMFSFLILIKFKKIANLTSLIYDQLSTNKSEGAAFNVSDNNAKLSARFEEHLSQHINKVEQQPHPSKPDPLMESHRFASQSESHTKTATKAESHLIKVLQGKYASHDEESFPPSGNQ